jgi:hypothetical protein
MGVMVHRLQEGKKITFSRWKKVLRDAGCQAERISDTDRLPVHYKFDPAH